MFAATTHQIVKSLGKDTLTPVRSLDRADYIAPFAIVLKERRRRLIFWKRTQCLSTEFALGDILETPLSDEEKAQLLKTHKLATFNYDTDYSLTGKFGVDLHKELLDVNADVSDTVNVKSDLGEVSKQEIHLQKLIDLTKNRNLNLKHHLVAPLLNDATKTLSLVTSVLRCKSDATISGKTNVKGSEEMQAVGDAVQESGNFTETKSKNLVVPADTAMAYTEYELQISKKNGLFRLILDRSRRGGFVTSLSVDLDEEDGPSDAMGATTLFQGIQNMSTEDRESLCLCTLRIVQVPICLDPLNDLLHKAADFLEMNVEKTTTVQSLRNKIPFLDEEPLLHFLMLMGFQQQENETVTYPPSSTEVFESCELLVSLLVELDDDALGVMASCLQDATTSQALISVLRPVWENDQCQVPLEGNRSWLNTTTGKQLTIVFGLKADDNNLQIPSDSLLDTQALYLVIDALMAGENLI